jgi:hypothetical protein
VLAPSVLLANPSNEHGRVFPPVGVSDGAETLDHRSGDGPTRP